MAGRPQIDVKKYNKERAHALMYAMQKYKTDTTISFSKLTPIQQYEIFKAIFDAYEFLSADVKYQLFFQYKTPGDKQSKMMTVTLDRSNLKEFIKLDRASTEKGGEFRLRFNPSKDQKDKLIKDFNATPFITKEGMSLTKKQFEEIAMEQRSTAGLNRGDTVEKMFFETVSKKKWKKDVSAFYKKGDIRIKNIEYQVKYQRATLVGADTLIYNLNKILNSDILK